MWRRRTLQPPVARRGRPGKKMLSCGGCFAGCLFALIVAVFVPILAAQGAPDAALVVRLREVFPQAASFSSKVDAPPHYKAYTTEPNTKRLVLAGVVFWTTDLEPLERGYGGPIRILVGMDNHAVLTGIAIAGHREPYGDFSIDLPEYAAQFRGKNIRDPFRVGADIHAVSRATITVSSATRSIRNSARRIARELLAPGPQSRLNSDIRLVGAEV
jgi:transcriptional regulator of nitric oxide reductase